MKDTNPKRETPECLKRIDLAIEQAKGITDILGSIEETLVVNEEETAHTMYQWQRVALYCCGILDAANKARQEMPGVVVQEVAPSFMEKAIEDGAVTTAVMPPHEFEVTKDGDGHMVGVSVKANDIGTVNVTADEFWEFHDGKAKRYGGSK